MFDLDGVLVRSEEAWFRSVEAAGSRFRGTPVTRSEFTPTFGQGTSADIRVFGLRCTPAELDEHYVETFPCYADSVWVNPDSGPLLQTLRERGHRLALVTNTVSALARVILAQAKLASAFDVLACADLVPRSKPAPDLLHYALEGLKVPASEAWMIGDSRYDREAAAAAHVHFVGLGLDGAARVEKLGDLMKLLDR